MAAATLSLLAQLAVQLVGVLVLITLAHDLWTGFQARYCWLTCYLVDISATQYINVFNIKSCSLIFNVFKQYILHIAPLT